MRVEPLGLRRAASTRASDPRAVPQQSLHSIQALRALAALMVVVYHVKPRLLRLGWDGAWPEWLGCGVDIFFVISGVIMWLTTSDRDITPGQFLLRRFLRIAPLYYAMTAVVVATMLVAPAVVAGGRISFEHIAASFLFLPAMHPVAGVMEPVLPQGWTLNYEMAFYGLFAVSLFLPRVYRIGALILALVAIVLAGIGSTPLSVSGFLSSSIILEFGFGLLIGAALTGGLRIGTGAAAVMFGAGIVAIPATWPLVESGIPRVWLSGVAASLIVLGAVSLERNGFALRNALLQRLGNASYSLYLTHGLAMSALGAVWARAGLGVGPFQLAAFVPLAIGVATVIGLLTYLAVERPMQRWFHRGIVSANRLTLIDIRSRFSGIRVR